MTPPFDRLGPYLSLGTAVGTVKTKTRGVLRRAGNDAAACGTYAQEWP
jgi:hypothetical protein